MEKGFAIEPHATRGRFCIVDLAIGHRLRNGRWTSFSVKEASIYLRSAPPLETRWLDDE